MSTSIVDPDRVSRLVQLAMAMDGSTIVQAATVYMAGEQLEASPLLPEDLSRPFTPPVSFDRAQRVLGASHLVVVTGRSGTGQRAAAVRLLEGVAGNPIAELSPDWEEPRVQKLRCNAGVRHLLDLTVEDAPVPERFGRDLIDHARRLKAEGAYLVIVVDSQQWRRCGPLVPSVTVPLEPPQPRAVIETHLGTTEPNRLRVLDEEPVASLLDKLRTSVVPPGELVRLAHLLRDVDGTKESLEQALGEYHRWQDFVQEQFGQEEAGRRIDEAEMADRRALLLAVAVLDDQPAAMILAARDDLRRRLKLGIPPGRGFGRVGLSDQLSLIGAQRVGDAVSVCRQRPGIDEAVLDHVWQEWPHLRATLEDWLADLSRDGGAASPALPRISRALVGLATRHHSPELLDVAKDWLKRGGAARQLAITMLSETSTNPEIGPAVRHALYRWAKATGTEPAVLTGIAEVCAGRLGQIHSGPALTRLRLIIERDLPPEVHGAARSALRALAAYSAVRLVVVQHAVAWLAAASTRHAGSEAFLAMLDPATENSIVKLLLDDADAASDFAALLYTAWRLVLEDPGFEDRAAAMIDSWLVATEAGELDEDAVLRLLGPLISSTLPQSSVISAVYGQTGDGYPAPQGPTGPPLRERLLQASLRQHRGYSSTTDAAPDTEPT